MSALLDLPTQNALLREILKELASGLRAIYGDNSPKIKLYGSYARGCPSGNSDIDILLIYPTNIHPGEEIRRVSNLLSEINLHYQVLISILPTTQEQFLSDSGIFWKNLRMESKFVNEI